MVLSRWSTFFGRAQIELYLYDKISDVSQHFVSRVLEAKGKFQEIRENATFGPELTEIMRRANCRGLSGMNMALSRPPGIQEIEDCMKRGGHDSHVELSLDMPVLRHCASSLENEWSRNIQGLESNENIFDQQRSTTKYISPNFWADFPESSALFNDVCNNYLNEIRLR
jgi:hypothetical protein